MTLVPRWARRISVALASVLVLAGCAGNNASQQSSSTPENQPTVQSSESATSSFPLTFTNADGSTTEIPTKPTKVVSTSVTVTGALLAFDAPVAGSAGAGNGKFFPQWATVAQEKGLEPLYPAGEVNLEAVIAADPDLIIVSSSGADSAKDNLTDLQAIAPTVVVDYGGQTWQELTLKLAEATGMTAEAEATISKFESLVADVKGAITVPAGTANIISFNGPGESNPIARAAGPHAQLLVELGFTIEDPDPSWHTQDALRNDFVWATYENLTKLTSQTTFILAQDNEGAKAFATDPVLANLPSVVEGQVYGLGKNSFRIDYFSATQIVETVRDNFSS